MRFIDREKLRPPEILFDKRTDVARREVETFIAQTRSKGGTRRPPQSDWLDGNPRFRAEMARLFGNCCAYCESATLSDPGALGGVVGRHRPNMLAQDAQGNTELMAYAWLIYDWDNLLWLCPTCARLKGNRFFIRGERGQPFTRVNELREREEELILDPCFHDPVQHLSFLPDGLVAPLTDEGKATIEVLDLGRPELVGRRRSAMQQLGEALRVGGVRTDGQILIGQNQSERGPYAGAVTCAISEFARAQNLPTQRVEDLAQYVNRLDEQDRLRFADDFLSQANALDFDLASTAPRTAPKRAPKPRQPSRIPNIRTLPNALHPITRVEIANFKALRKIAFDLPERVADAGQSPCMLLLGENATGKSSVLEAMALAVIGRQEAKALDAAITDEKLSPADLIYRPDLYRWTETAPEMAVRLRFLDAEEPVELTAQARDAQFSGSDRCAKVVLGYGPRRFFTSRKTRRLRAPAHRVRSLFDPMDMIANPILWLSDLNDKAYFAAARALREVLMLDDADDFERDVDPDRRCCATRF